MTEQIKIDYWCNQSIEEDSPVKFIPRLTHSCKFIFSGDLEYSRVNVMKLVQRKRHAEKKIPRNQLLMIRYDNSQEDIKKMRHLLIRHHCRRAASNNEEYRCMNKLSYDVVINYFCSPFPSFADIE